MPIIDLIAAAQTVAPAGGALTLLSTALLLGVRHGIDWDHIAAITDITSTSAAGDVVEQPAATEPTSDAPGRRHGIVLGTLYALGHASVVAALGLAALLFGALLPDWIDPILSRVVGVTLIVLGIWVFYSVYAHMRHGAAFRIRSRWMLVFGSIRYSWQWFRAKLHGHDHVRPVEASSYGPRTAFGVGMIHGIGAETGSQVLIIAAVGGAASVGLGVPMMVAFIIGLLISNSVIVIVSSTGFVASRMRQRIYLVLGITAGILSLVVGAFLLAEVDGVLPDLGQVFGFIGTGP